MTHTTHSINHLTISRKASATQGSRAKACQIQLWYSNRGATRGGALSPRHTDSGNGSERYVYQCGELGDLQCGCHANRFRSAQQKCFNRKRNNVVSICGALSTIVIVQSGTVRFAALSQRHFTCPFEWSRYQEPQPKGFDPIQCLFFRVVTMCRTSLCSFLFVRALQNYFYPRKRSLNGFTSIRSIILTHSSLFSCNKSRFCVSG